MKKIIIIGGTSGIGKELALLYAGQKNRIAVTGRRKNLLDDLERSLPHGILTSCFDVTGSQNHTKVAELIQALGGLDLLIYNAGYGQPSAQLDWETERQTVQTNVTGFTEIVLYAFTYFAGQGYGQIAVTSSVAGGRGNSWAPAYSASKAFISRYAEGLNIKAKKLGMDIVITDIRPGFVATKEAVVHKRFWVATAPAAARQMITAIEKKKRVAYVTKRWWLIAQLLKIVPFRLYRRFG